jgi:hypothetical protein
MNRGTFAWVLVSICVSCSGVDESGSIATTELELRSTSQEKLVAPQPTTGDRLGNAVAMSGGALLLGASAADIGSAIDQGSAAVYVRSGTGWVHAQTLLAPGGVRNAQFGRSVALSGDTAVIGADQAAGGSGAAYVFPDSFRSRRVADSHVGSARIRGSRVGERTGLPWSCRPERSLSSTRAPDTSARFGPAGRSSAGETIKTVKRPPRRRVRSP